MKILFLSMPSIHALRWIENLKNTDNELYWFDVTDKGTVSGFENLTHYVNWKKRKLPHIKGEYRFSRHFPFTYMKVKHLFETTENEFLEKIKTILAKYNQNINRNILDKKKESISKTIKKSC